MTLPASRGRFVEDLAAPDPIETCCRSANSLRLSIRVIPGQHVLIAASWHALARFHTLDSQLPPSTSSSQILADMEGPEMTPNTRLPMARCDAADVIDQSEQLSFRHSTESIGCASDGRHR